MRLAIGPGMRIVNEDTGEPVENITKMEMSMDAAHGPSGLMRVSMELIILNGDMRSVPVWSPPRGSTGPMAPLPRPSNEPMPPGVRGSTGPMPPQPWLGVAREDVSSTEEPYVSPPEMGDRWDQV